MSHKFSNDAYKGNSRNVYELNDLSPLRYESYNLSVKTHLYSAVLWINQEVHIPNLHYDRRPTESNSYAPMPLTLTTSLTNHWCQLHLRDNSGFCFQCQEVKNDTFILITLHLITVTMVFELWQRQRTTSFISNKVTHHHPHVDDRI